MTPENIMLRDRSQMQKTAYCRIPLMLSIQKRQIYRDRKVSGGWVGAWIGCKQE